MWDLVLSNILSNIRSLPVYIPEGRYDYLTQSGREHVVRLTESGSETMILSHIQVGNVVNIISEIFINKDSYHKCLALSVLKEVKSVAEGSRVINSVLEGDVRVSAGAVVQHCHLQVWRILSNI